MKKECVKQHHISDCGAACLVSVAAHFGLIQSLEKVRQWSGTQTQGISVQGLKEGAKELHLQTKAYCHDHQNSTLDPITALSHLPLPSILHLINDEGFAHFCVLYASRKGKRPFLIMDPKDGKMQWRKKSYLSEHWTGVVVTIEKGKDFAPENHVPSFFTRMGILLKGQWKCLLVILLSSLLCTGLALLSALFLQALADQIVPSGDTSLLGRLAVAMALILGGSLLLDTFRSLVTVRTNLQLGSRLVMGFFRHTTFLPQRFFDQRPSGELIARINDAFKVSTFLSSGLVNLTLCLFSALFSFVILFNDYWKLALVCAAALPLYAIVFFAFDRTNKTTQQRLAVAQATLEAHLVDTFRGITQIKYNTAQEQVITTTRDKLQAYITRTYQSATNAIVAGSASETVTRAMSLLLLWGGTTLVIGKELTIGEVLSFYTLSAYFSGPVSEIIAFSQKYQDARVSSQRLFEVMELPCEQSSVPLSKASPATDNSSPQINDIWEFPPQGNLSMEGIRFHYPGRLTLFQHFTHTFSCGRITAVAGESGSGKSTLASLLMRLYLPEEGVIRWGNCQANDIPLDYWRQHIGIVPQKADLFEGTLKDNILLGKEDKDMERIVQLCDLLGLTSFIESLPQGILTPLGEQGLQLSGGQRQRLALVRAVYRRPQWLLLDEATSSLDSDSEQIVVGALQQWRNEGMGIIVIAHRMASLSCADHILVLNKGELEEEGTHQELISLNGKYAAWCMQQGIIAKRACSVEFRTP